MYYVELKNFRFTVKHFHSYLMDTSQLPVKSITIKSTCRFGFFNEPELLGYGNLFFIVPLKRPVTFTFTFCQTFGSGSATFCF